MNQPPLLSASLHRRIMAAELNEASKAEKKALYIEQNCWMPEDTAVYRIFQFQYLSEDIRSERLTHIRPEAWNDPLENPLANHVWPEPNGEKVSMRGILDQLFGQSWTLSGAEQLDFWHALLARATGSPNSDYCGQAPTRRNVPRKSLLHAQPFFGESLVQPTGRYRAVG